MAGAVVTVTAGGNAAPPLFHALPNAQGGHQMP